MKTRDEIRTCLDRMLFSAIQGMKTGDPDRVHIKEMLSAKEEAHKLLLQLGGSSTGIIRKVLNRVF